MTARAATTIATEPAERLAYAPFGPRAGALLIDLSLYVFWGNAFGALYASAAPDPDVWGPVSVSGVISLAVWWAYFVVTTAILGGTLGKAAFRLWVVTTDFRRPDWTTVVYREVVGRILVTATVFIGYLWAAFDRRHQGWHDKVADTLVVRRVRTLEAPDPWSGEPGPRSAEEDETDG